MNQLILLGSEKFIALPPTLQNFIKKPSPKSNSISAKVPVSFFIRKVQSRYLVVESSKTHFEVPSDSLSPQQNTCTSLPKCCSLLSEKSNSLDLIGLLKLIDSLLPKAFWKAPIWMGECVGSIPAASGVGRLVCNILFMLGSVHLLIGFISFFGCESKN